MDAKLDDRLERAGFETIEPEPGPTQPPRGKFIVLSPLTPRRPPTSKPTRRGFVLPWVFPLLFCPLARPRCARPWGGSPPGC